MFLIPNTQTATKIKSFNPEHSDSDQNELIRIQCLAVAELVTFVKNSSAVLKECSK